MVAKLVAEEGDLKGLVLSFEGREEWTIGRDADLCELTIPDPLISRQHALASLSSEGIYLKNLSETNPVSINNELLGEEPQLLHHGDALLFGNELFYYYVDSEAHILDEAYPTAVAKESPEEEDSVLKEKTNTEQEEKDSENRQSTGYDTVMTENEENFAPLAEIDFGLADFGRWLMKVVSGPNNGAEFYMQSGYEYILGTDTASCDIVFYDTSVSRQHAKISVSEEDTLFIEDLKSKNGTLVDGKKIETKQQFEPTKIITIGTSAFIIYDREGEMQTIISPLLPSIVKALQEDGKKENQAVIEPFNPAVEQQKIEAEEQAAISAKPQTSKWPFIGLIAGVVILLVVGTHTLFNSEPIKETVGMNAEENLKKVMQAYPTIQWTYNKSTGGVLLLGHLSTAAEKNQLLYTLHSMPSTIKSIDETGIIIDEGVWREINSILSKNPAWQGITIHSPEAGKFVLSGTLKTRQQANQLYDYISLNFPYLDLLKKDVLVEEDVVNQINNWLLAAGFNKVVVQMSNGEVTLSGTIPTDLEQKLPLVIAKIEAISGIRAVYNLTRSKAMDLGIKNISGQYQVTGSTKVGDKYTVQINGRILSQGDQIDGMTITKITANQVALESGDKKFKIEY